MGILPTFLAGLLPSTLGNHKRGCALKLSPVPSRLSFLFCNNEDFRRGASVSPCLEHPVSLLGWVSPLGPPVHREMVGEAGKGATRFTTTALDPGTCGLCAESGGGRGRGAPRAKPLQAGSPKFEPWAYLSLTLGMLFRLPSVSFLYCTRLITPTL